MQFCSQLEEGMKYFDMLVLKAVEGRRSNRERMHNVGFRLEIVDYCQDIVLPIKSKGKFKFVISNISFLEKELTKKTSDKWNEIKWCECRKHENITH
jgi:hypothetical protein